MTSPFISLFDRIPSSEDIYIQLGLYNESHRPLIYNRIRSHYRIQDIIEIQEYYGEEFITDKNNQSLIVSAGDIVQAYQTHLNIQSKQYPIVIISLVPEPTSNEEVSPIITHTSILFSLNNLSIRLTSDKFIVRKETDDINKFIEEFHSLFRIIYNTQEIYSISSYNNLISFLPPLYQHRNLRSDDLISSLYSSEIRVRINPEGDRCLLVVNISGIWIVRESSEATLLTTNRDRKDDMILEGILIPPSFQKTSHYIPYYLAIYDALYVGKDIRPHPLQERLNFIKGIVFSYRNLKIELLSYNIPSFSLMKNIEESIHNLPYITRGYVFISEDLRLSSKIDNCSLKERTLSVRNDIIHWDYRKTLVFIVNNNKLFLRTALGEFVEEAVLSLEGEFTGLYPNTAVEFFLETLDEGLINFIPKGRVSRTYPDIEDELLLVNFIPKETLLGESSSLLDLALEREIGDSYLARLIKNKRVLQFGYFPIQSLLLSSRKALVVIDDDKIVENLSNTLPIIKTEEELNREDKVVLLSNSFDSLEVENLIISHLDHVDILFLPFTSFIPSFIQRLKAIDVIYITIPQVALIYSSNYVKVDENDIIHYSGESHIIPSKISSLNLSFENHDPNTLHGNTLLSPIEREFASLILYGKFTMTNNNISVNLHELSTLSYLPERIEITEIPFVVSIEPKVADILRPLMLIGNNVNDTKKLDFLPYWRIAVNIEESQGFYDALLLSFYKSYAIGGKEERKRIVKTFKKAYDIDPLFIGYQLNLRIYIIDITDARHSKILYKGGPLKAKGNIILGIVQYHNVPYYETLASFNKFYRSIFSFREIEPISSLPYGILMDYSITRIPKPKNISNGKKYRTFDISLIGEAEDNIVEEIRRRERISGPIITILEDFMDFNIILQLNILDNNIMDFTGLMYTFSLIYNHVLIVKTRGSSTYHLVAHTSEKDNEEHIIRLQEGYIDNNIVDKSYRDYLTSIHHHILKTQGLI